MELDGFRDLERAEPAEEQARPEQLRAEDEQVTESVEKQDSYHGEIGAALAYYHLSTALANEQKPSRVWRRISRTARKNRKARWVAVSVAILFGLSMILNRRTELEVSANAGALVQPRTPVASQPAILVPVGPLAIAPTPLGLLPAPVNIPLSEPTATVLPTAKPTSLPLPASTKVPTLAPHVTLVPTAVFQPQKAGGSAPSSSGSVAPSSSVSSPPPAPSPAPPSDNAVSSGSGSKTDKGKGQGGGNGDSHGGGNSGGADGGKAKGKGK